MTFLMEKGLGGLQCVKMCPVDASACHIKSHSSLCKAGCRPKGGPSDHIRWRTKLGNACVVSSDRGDSGEEDEAV